MNEKIIEGNKLIAEFMGLSYCNKYRYEGWYQNNEHNFRICDFDSLKYHSSWDWLIPVVEKILRTENNGSDWEKYYTQIHDSLWSINIESTWLSVVEFIKWCNENK